MSAAENIEKLVKKFFKTRKSSAATSDKLDKKVLTDALAAFEKSKTTESAEFQPSVWRIIMKSSITKLAVAAVLVIAAVMSVTLLNKATAPAYAIEQTIEALKNTRIVHMFCRDWDGKKFEMWMTLDSQGYPEYCYSYWPDYEVTNISTPTVSYQYNKKMNQVSVNKGKLYYFDVQFDRMFEDLQKEVQKSESNVKVYREAASSGSKSLIVAICGEGDESESWKVFIDPETKLPVGLHCLKSRDRPGEFIRDFDEIRFDEELPAGIFEFQIPEGATVSNIDDEEKRLSDPNNGISTEGLTEQQAAEQIAGQYWRAIIDKDLEKAKKVYPRTNSDEEVEKKYQKYFGDYFPSEYVESGRLYVEHNCGLGKVLPCILMFEDGRKREVKIIIRFRNIDGKSSCVIAGHFGYPVEID